MPERLLRSARLRIGAVIFGTYWLLALTVGTLFDWEIVTVAMLFVMTFVSIGVILLYVPIVWRSALLNDRGPVSQLSTGILLAFLGLVVLLVSTLVAGIWPETKPWTADTRLHGFAILLYIVAGSIHMTARRDYRGRIRRDDWMAVLVCHLAGITLTAAVIVLQALQGLT